MMQEENNKAYSDDPESAFGYFVRAFHQRKLDQISSKMELVGGREMLFLFIMFLKLQSYAAPFSDVKDEGFFTALWYYFSQ